MPGFEQQIDLVLAVFHLVPDRVAPAFVDLIDADVGVQGVGHYLDDQPLALLSVSLYYLQLVPLLKTLIQLLVVYVLIEAECPKINNQNEVQHCVFV